ncbi:hypothetical protein A2U01_0030300, partial [Trifolium medium]|nr:hypothetical protein [Trifolium medium]
MSDAKVVINLVVDVDDDAMANGDDELNWV